jgi:probable HAF family extracellular repeat protein
MKTNIGGIAGRRAVILAALLAGALPAAAQPRFELLEAPAPGPWADFSLSRDGSQLGCVMGGAVYWWSKADGYRFLDHGVPSGGGVGMAADGSALIAARAGADGAVPTVWFRDGTSLELGPRADDCGRSHSPDGGFDLSAGARVAVGQVATCDNEMAFLWTRTGGLRILEAQGAASRGSAVSADGRVVVGFCKHPRAGYRRPALWRDGAGPEFFLGPQREGEALGVSLDGSRIVGQADLGGASPQAFHWTVTGGVVNLGSIGGRAATGSLARAVSDDGRVVGWSGDAVWGDQVAFLWTAATGMRALAAVLEEAGVALPDDMVLTAALDISGDGGTVVGIARDRDWIRHFWRIRLDDTVDPAPGARTPRTDPPVAVPDSLDIQQADMFDPLPFTRRRY